VRTASGRFRWVDEDAVLLGEMLPTDQIPAFFMRGLNEDDPEGARKENRERVAKFLELQHAWDQAGLSERVSEVNLIDVADVRAQLAGDDSRIEVRLGSEEQAERLQDALQVLDDQRQSPQGALISYIDLSQGKRKKIIGLTSGVRATSDGIELSNSDASSGGANIDPARKNASTDPIGALEDATSRGRTNKSSKPEKKPEKSKKDRQR
jgi:hypothetical protein